MVLHPYAGASKPIPDWESMPSRPLPFAATLHDLDLNAQASSESLTPRIPRPRRYHADDSLRDLPTPVAYTRHASISSSSQIDRHGVLGSPSARKPTIGSDEWMQMKVGYCVDHATSDLNLSDCRLERVSTKIADMGDLVTLPSTRSPKSSPSRHASGRLSRHLDVADMGQRTESSSSSKTLSERSFARTQSAPTAVTPFSRLRPSPPVNLPAANQSGGGSSLLPAARLTSASSRGRNDEADHADGTSGSPLLTSSPQSSLRRQLARSKTGAVDFNKRTSPNTAVYLSQNLLTSLPSALFEIRNLTVLTLRNNQLQSLPAAIGELIHLKELNISNNRIEYLPSTIQNLTALEIFHPHPNRWLARPTEPVAQDASAQDWSSPATSRVLSPLRSSVDLSVPRLGSLCINTLLSPRNPDNLPPFIDYDWDSCKRGGEHPLLDPNALKNCIPFIQLDDAARILQAVKSACTAATRGPTGGQSSRRINPFPRSYATPEPDDASTNPYYYPCPSPRHHEWDGDAPPLYQRPTRRVFLHRAEERFEWISVANHKDLPIQWLGCSPGCLAFLEEDKDEWGMDSDEFDI